MFTYRVRVFEGPDGSTATGVCGHAHSTYVEAVKCCEKIQAQGHGAGIQSRLFVGQSWGWLADTLQPGHGSAQAPVNNPTDEG